MSTFLSISLMGCTRRRGLGHSAVAEGRGLTNERRVLIILTNERSVLTNERQVLPRNPEEGGVGKRGQAVTDCSQFHMDHREADMKR